MNQTDRCKKWMVQASKFGSRLFRNNTGRAWTGNKIKKNRDGSLTIFDPRPFHSGLCKGSSDLIGWTPTEITADMVGKTIAVFTAVEDKSKTDRAREEQENFINAVNNSGGVAGVCRTPEDLDNILSKVKTFTQ